MSSATRQKLIALALKTAKDKLTKTSLNGMKQDRVFSQLGQTLRRTSAASTRINATTSTASGLPSVPLTLTPLSLATTPSISLIGSGRTRSSSPTRPKAQPRANSRPANPSVVKTVERCMPSGIIGGGPLLAR